MTKIQNVAIGGFGAIGMAVARKIDEGMQGLRLAAVSARDREAAKARMSGYRNPVPVVAASELALHGDCLLYTSPSPRD